MASLFCILQRLRGRPGFQLAAGSRLGVWARILNLSGGPERIRIGTGCMIRGELFTFAHGGEIEVGNWCYVGDGSRIWSASRITIGDRVLIAHNVNVFDSLTHPVDALRRHAHFRAIMQQGHPKAIDLDERPVCIGSDVWIGAGASILRGVRVGRGAIVGAGSVVTRDVPDWCIVAGNPARVVRQLEPVNVDSPA